jgi:hypothetical protein
MGERPVIGYTHAMNSGQDASPDLPDADDPDATAAGGTDIDPDIDTETLQRSRDAIDQGHEAAREALKDEAGLTSGDPEEPPGGAPES